MPYLLISTQIRLESGPTILGDEDVDSQIMEYLGAKLMTQIGNSFPQWQTEDPPRIVLNKLEKLGYKVIAMTGVGQTCAWTMYKPLKVSKEQ